MGCGTPPHKSWTLGFLDSRVYPSPERPISLREHCASPPGSFSLGCQDVSVYAYRHNPRQPRLLFGRSLEKRGPIRSPQRLVLRFFIGVAGEVNCRKSRELSSPVSPPCPSTGRVRGRGLRGFPNVFLRNRARQEIPFVRAACPH